MERNNLMSDNLKNHSINGGRTMKDNNINNKVMKDSWKIIRGNDVGETSGGVVGADLFSWPPRSYTCTFCKREFRSAQALGGHMNVHRRDRARLRQSPQINGQDFSTFNLNLDPGQNPNPNPSPSPNPNFSSSSTSTAFFRQPFTSNFPTLASPTLSSISNSPSSASPGTEIKKWRRDGALTDQLSPRPNDNITKIKSTKALLGVREFNGLFQGKECEVVKKGEIVRLEIGMLTDSKNDLDLELRLGYS